MIYMSVDDVITTIPCSSLWGAINSLKVYYPKFKVTYFAIPAYYNPLQAQPWEQAAPHGVDHIADGKEHLLVLNYPLKNFILGYKAPKWKIDRVGIQLLNEAGYWVAVRQEDVKTCELQNNNIYVYNSGTRIKHNFIYWFKGDYFIHTHVNNNKINGVVENLSLLLSMWKRDTEFGFINDYMRRKNESITN